MRISERGTNSKKWIYISLIALSIISIFKRLFFGWDQDESYIILLPIKIANGSSLFSDLWDLHQTAAIFMAPFCKAYITIAGSTDGIAIFLRIISVLFQMVLSVYAYIVLKKHVGSYPAFMTAIVILNLLPRATQQLEYGALSMWAALASNLILYDLLKDDRLSYWKLALSAVMYSVAVLSYPTMAITLLAYIYIFLRLDRIRSEKQKIIGVFVGICFLLAVCFLVWVIMPLGIPMFLKNLHAMANSGDHAQMFAALFNVKSLVKSIVRIVGGIIVAFVVTKLTNKHFGLSLSSFYTYIFLMSLLVIILNVTGIRPSGPFGFLERYIGMVILGVGLSGRKKDKLLWQLFFINGIGFYLGSLMGSNLGINENAMFMELTIIACVVYACLDHESEKRGSIFVQTATVVFVVGVIFSSAFFVRINSTSPANVFQCTERFNYGPLSGVFVRKDQMDDLSKRMKAVSELTEAGKTYAVLGNESIYNLMVKGTTSAPRYVSTVQYNEQWIDYYDKFGHPVPEVILVNTFWYSDIEEFFDTIWGEKWVKDKYSLQETEYDNMFMKLVYKGTN